MGNIFKNLLYALPFGLKAADEEIAGSTPEATDGTHIQKQVENKSMLNALLNGELTQEVEELRYRTYEVAEKSRDYKYVGNGTAVKKERNTDRTVIRFSQESKLIVASVLEELSRVGDYGIEKYSTDFEYKRFSRFKIEAYLKMIDVLIKDGVIQTKLHFNSEPNPYNANSAPFINELKRIKDAIVSEYALNRNEIANVIETMTFITSNATNDEPNLMQYKFISPKLTDYEESNGEIILTYIWDSYECENLREKFFSASMAEKYANKEKKDIIYDMSQNISEKNE